LGLYVIWEFICNTVVLKHISRWNTDTIPK
jgi:hypothetical protein